MSQPPPDPRDPRSDPRDPWSDPRDPWSDPPPYGSTPYGPAPYGSTPPGNPGSPPAQGPGLPPGQQPTPSPYQVQGPYPTYPSQGPYPSQGQYPAQSPFPAQPPAGPPPPGAWSAYGPLPYAGAPGQYSEKTRAAAGLLQLLPGFFLAIGGIGRCYSGHVGLGVSHLVLSVLGWLLTPFGIGILLLGASWLWAVIDGIVLLAGRPTDPHGRLLR